MRLFRLKKASLVTASAANRTAMAAAKASSLPRAAERPPHRGPIGGRALERAGVPAAAVSGPLLANADGPAGRAAAAIVSGAVCWGSNWPATRPWRKTTTRSAFSITSGRSELISTTAAPRSASSASSRWISDFAPTSTPRVGSSSSSTAGSASSQRASTTFCWLPPESSAIGCSASRHLMASRSIMAAVAARSRAALASGPRRQRPSVLTTALARIDKPRNTPCCRRSSGR